MSDRDPNDPAYIALDALPLDERITLRAQRQEALKEKRRNAGDHRPNHNQDHAKNQSKIQWRERD